MKAFLKVILLLLIPLALLLAYALTPREIEFRGVRLEKVRSPWIEHVAELADHDSVFADSSASESDAVPAMDSSVGAGHPASPPDTVRRILFFGDSMLEGLGKRMCDYAMENGYELTSVIWYSSTTQLWAETDTLQYFFDRVRPDYVMLCLGSNELFVRDLDNRDRYISRLVAQLSDYRFVWISPPNWKDDTGINQLIINHVGHGRYFDSRYLDLKRASDHAHPTHAAAAQWMDSVAVWLNTSARHPLAMKVPVVRRPRHFQQILLKPVR